MSKKTTKKAAAPKSTKAVKKPVEQQPASECPRGGEHEWTEEGGEKHCAKCKEPAPAKGKKAKAEKGTKAAKAAKPAKEKKVSALDAAAQVLASAKEPMNSKALIEQMAAKGLWSSPGGKTPHATLYAAIIREITEKGKDARFKKTDRGHFAANG